LFFSPDCKKLVARGARSLLKAWDLESKNELLATTVWISTPVITKNGKYLVAATPTGLKAWDLELGIQSTKFTSSTTLVIKCFLVCNNTQVVTVSSEVVKIWDMNSGQELMSVPNVPCIHPINKGDIVVSREYKVAFDGKRVVYLTLDGNIEVLNIESQKMMSIQKKLSYPFAETCVFNDRKANKVVMVYLDVNGDYCVRKHTLVNDIIRICSVVSQNKIFIGCESGHAHFLTMC